MSLLRRVTIAAAAAAMGLTGLTALPSQAAEVDVYTTPGGHIQNGRLWDTTCAMYSPTVVRCTTKIWATQISYEKGRFVNKTGWHFNNLTYLPAARSVWKGNPLGDAAATNKGYFTSGGRNWFTECDTAKTGGGACRSYIESDFIAYEGGRHVNKRGLVFNNLVRFAEGKVTPVTSVPAHVLDQSKLTVDGLGPLTHAAKKETVLLDLERLGYVKKSVSDVCETHVETAELTKRGISVMGLADVAVSKPGIKTPRGAEVGMTIGQIKALYGSEFKQVLKQNHGEKQYLGSVKIGNRELQFRVLGEKYSDGTPRYAPLGPLKDSDVVVEISAQTYTTDVSFGGC
ncbi:MAG: hypothetical protein Q4G35_01815 [Propionibacteriaceae bacterium]|nr:hypothetical protein [Propionibacteriaceae bacterium]